METNHISILHIEDNQADVVLVQEILAEAKEYSGTVLHAGLLALGLEKLNAEAVDIILLDLSLPDSSGKSTFRAVKERARDTPSPHLAIKRMRIDLEQESQLQGLEIYADPTLMRIVFSNLVTNAIKYGRRTV